jgi:hypothetical protein
MIAGLFLKRLRPAVAIDPDADLCMGGHRRYCRGIPNRLRQSREGRGTLQTNGFSFELQPGMNRLELELTSK